MHASTHTTPVIRNARVLRWMAALGVIVLMLLLDRGARS